MSKILKTTVVSAVVLGIAAASPLSAQARGGAQLPLHPTMFACPGLGLSDAQATVSGTSFSASGTGAPNNQYSIRARYSYVAAGSTTTTFARDKSVTVTTTATGAFSTPVTRVPAPAGATKVTIYRMDGVDITSPLDNIAWTTDGVAACD